MPQYALSYDTIVNSNFVRYSRPMENAIVFCVSTDVALFNVYVVPSRLVATAVIDLGSNNGYTEYK